MKVKEILAFFSIQSDDNTIITSISNNSKKGKGKWIYFNLSSLEHSQEYIQDAINHNAYLIISKHQVENVIYVPHLDDKINDFLIYFYHFKKNFKLIGVTGTNGKSSLSNFLKQCLLLNHFRVKNVTTYKDHFAYFSPLTTPDSFRLFEILNKANKEKLDYLIMEISSIGYCLKRVNSIDFDYLFLTNVTSDHLDFHKTLEEYQNTKVNIINESQAIKFIDEHLNDQFLFYGKINWVKYHLLKEENKNILKIGKTRVNSNLIFKTNLINLSFCYYFLRKIGLKKHYTLLTLSRVKPLKGRLDVVSKNPLIIIDYAHSPSSFENVILEAKEIFNKKVILVFGAGGDRDKSKRSEYAKIANKYAYITILTNDNPRSESPEEIVNQMKNYISHIEVIYDRKEAIKRGINLTENDKMLLILGKGNEDYILMDNYKIFHNDYYEVEKCLAKDM